MPQPAAVRHKVTVFVEGQMFNGHYKVIEGEVQVESVFGSPCGRSGEDPRLTAADLLRAVVDTWRS